MAEERVQRRLAAILAADVVGYSRLIEADEEGTRVRLRSLQAELINPRIAADGGRIVKTTGDGVLVEFPSAIDAVRNALAIQEALRRRNADVPEATRIEFRVGINVGDVIVEGDDIHGEGVNVAARLEGLCEAGGVYVSAGVHDYAVGKLAAVFEDLGERTVKNIARPVRVYRVRSDTGRAPSTDKADAALPLPDKPSIAVLPFDNMSGDAEQDYFADGIAEDIITALSRFRWFFVIARNSSFSFKGQKTDIGRVAEELGVRYVLEGSVRKSGNRVRISAQLIEAAASRHVWAERYDRDLHDIFAVQDEITDAIAGAVAPSFVSAEFQRSERKPPESLDAWDVALRGNWHLWRQGRDDISEARRLFETAVSLDPRSVVAQSGLAMACGYQMHFRWIDDVGAARATAMEAARRAVALGDQDAWAQVALSHVLTLSREYDAAFRAAGRAVELNPNLAFAEALLAQRYAWLADYDQAVRHADRAARLSPRDPSNFFWIFARTVAAFTASKYEESLEWAVKLTETVPQFPAGWSFLAVDNTYLGRPDQAQAALQEFIRLVPDANIGFMRNLLPARRKEDADRFIEGMQMAGLPESPG